jgi:hypothetical protein
MGQFFNFKMLCLIKQSYFWSVGYSVVETGSCLRGTMMRGHHCESQTEVNVVVDLSSISEKVFFGVTRLDSYWYGGAVRL